MKQCTFKPELGQGKGDTTKISIATANIQNENKPSNGQAKYEQLYALSK